MSHIYLLAEGQSEKLFSEGILRPHLAVQSIFLAARCVTISEGKREHIHYRGGGASYQKIKKDLTAWIKEHQLRQDAYFTSMIDLYALPNSFPGYEEARKISDPYKRVSFLEQAWYDDVGFTRFSPYIQLHEFEALLLCDVKRLTSLGGETKEWVELEKLVDSHRSPEHVNEGLTTAPSKRIAKAFSGYAKTKTTAARTLAPLIGLSLMRQKCPHFNEWVMRLESLK